MQKAVLDYPNSDNLGDFIQSIAAAAFLDENPVFLDRDQLHLGTSTPTQLILNGWFMEQPRHWPPGPGIVPLFLSFHINPTAQKQMLSPEGIAYLQKYAPIGCRDHYTLQLLQKHQIPAYFSGCLTLSLNRQGFPRPQQAPQEPYILLCSALERLNPKNNPSTSGLRGLLNTLKNVQRAFRFQRANRRLEAFLAQAEQPIVRKSQIVSTQKYNRDERYSMAEEQLQWIAHAKIVVTSRIHTALPAVAMGIPVLFLSDGLEHPNQQSRLEGLTQLFHSYKTSDLTEVNLEQLSPTTDHYPLAEEIRKKVVQFWGC